MWIFVFSGRTNLNSCHRKASPTAVLFDSASEVELIMQRVDCNQAASPYTGTTDTRESEAMVSIGTLN